MDTKIGQSTAGEMLPLLVVIAILLLIAVFSLYMIVQTSKAKKKQKEEQFKLKAQGMLHQIIATHTYGLPLADGIVCTIQLYINRMDFISGNTHISLMKEKIVDVCIKNETEIQQQYVSSVGGAVGGAMLFGPLGAVIGGRAKKKTSSSVTSYLIVTYKNDSNSLSYLAFDVSYCLLQANKIVAEFRRNNINGETHIEL